MGVSPGCVRFHSLKETERAAEKSQKEDTPPDSLRPQMPHLKMGVKILRWKFSTNARWYSYQQPHLTSPALTGKDWPEVGYFYCIDACTLYSCVCVCTHLKLHTLYHTSRSMCPSQVRHPHHKDPSRCPFKATLTHLLLHPHS